jgi:hypothetical protein
VVRASPGHPEQGGNLADTREVLLSRRPAAPAEPRCGASGRSGAGTRSSICTVPVSVRAMTEIVLRVRLIGGDHTDVSYDEPETAETQHVLDHVISTLAADSGVLRCSHGDRLVVLYGRGVAAVEAAPRGAVV